MDLGSDFFVMERMRSDFGMAKHLNMQTLTATGQVWGTLMYIAPEQLL